MNAYKQYMSGEITSGEYAALCREAWDDYYEDTEPDEEDEDEYQIYFD